MSFKMFLMVNILFFIIAMEDSSSSKKPFLFGLFFGLLFMVICTGITIFGKNFQLILKNLDFFESHD